MAQKRIVDPSEAREKSAALFHCDLSSLQPVGVREDLGPFKSLDQMVEFTGKSVEQWRRERRELATQKALRRSQRAAGTPRKTALAVDLWELLKA